MKFIVVHTAHSDGSMKPTEPNQKNFNPMQMVTNGTTWDGMAFTLCKSLRFTDFWLLFQPVSLKTCFVSNDLLK